MYTHAFTAINCIVNSNNIFTAAKIELADNEIILQDCSWLKGAGCTLGPFSWCALAGLGGASAYWNCVDKASGGDCLDCLTGNDPRDNQDRSTSGYAGVNEGGKFVGYGSDALTSDVDINIYNQLTEINKKLTKIENCACPLTVLTKYPFNYSQYLTHINF